LGAEEVIETEEEHKSIILEEGGPSSAAGSGLMNTLLDVKSTEGCSIDDVDDDSGVSACGGVDTCGGTAKMRDKAEGPSLTTRRGFGRVITEDDASKMMGSKRFDGAGSDWGETNRGGKRSIFMTVEDRSVVSKDVVSELDDNVSNESIVKE
jgi:hypothetical protein